MFRLARTLKFQISLALLMLVGLFAASTLYSLHTLEHQHSDDLLLRLGGQLQITQQSLTMQAMNYKDNAPRNYDAYFRDLRLYFKDFSNDRDHINKIIKAFASEQFPQSLTRQQMASTQPLDPKTKQAAQDLETIWEIFNDTLQVKLGDKVDEPRLEWGSDWILEKHGEIDRATSAMLSALEESVEQRAKQTRLFGRSMLIISLLASTAILFWFYFKVLRPLDTAAQGFRRVSTGDFIHRVPIESNNEIGWMIGAFNELSSRLDILLKLITGLQKGSNLDETLGFVSDTLPKLLPLDWVGILIQGPDGHMHLEHSYRDGKPNPIGHHTFKLKGTLLEECLQSHHLLRIADVNDTAALDRHYRFLKLLNDQGQRDAIFMPLLENKPVVGVIVFASRHPNTYHPEHLSLLSNLSLLISLSFGRSMKLAESSRLAEIGQFASGIVHEIRNPLATISLATEHFLQLENLPTGTSKRAQLADKEIARLSLLLDDILLYAKPMQLKRKPLRLAQIFSELENSALLQSTHIHIDDMSQIPDVALDSDRMKQVILNLLKNALDANADDPRGVRVHTQIDTNENKLYLKISNGGKAIEAEKLKRIFEPFYTSKSSGTGLGLPIVRRIVHAHGGEIDVTSDTRDGTHVILKIPLF